MRVGLGYDIHRLVPGRPLRLGGVEIPSPVGLLGHSDGDALLHAVCDALLGAAALGDLGDHFPDTDPAFLGADSAHLLRQALAKVRAAGYQPANLDATVVAQQPRLGPHKAAIRQRLADLLALDPSLVSLKAKSNNGLDAVGQGLAIAAHAVVLIENLPEAP
ncbi:MAG TPA: 2-C-methyl-D-erythritol 2,4-cyclodiphosphate synthase [Planctomycetota bacterium]|nr:2-C-methyl-D-erythritol 2,4-cyclodiphosphate synthase [Planctomycetota bacterium]HRR79866.1 2-C-methyl-D-erythritol 2,4-cyclodiphosphate synthase [Planctomycetota bacterium]